MSDGGGTKTATRRNSSPSVPPADLTDRGITPSTALGNAATARGAAPAAGGGSSSPSAALGNAATARGAAPAAGGGSSSPSAALGNAATARATTPVSSGPVPAFFAAPGGSAAPAGGGSFGGGSFGGGGAGGSYGPPPGPAPGIREPVELKGRSSFAPPADLAEEIKAFGGISVPVAVKFGSLATGEIPVFWSGRSFETKETGPLLRGHHPVPIHHPAFPVTPGAYPVLGVKIRGNAPTGFLDWLTPATHPIDPLAFLALHPVEELFGWKGIEADPPSEVESSLSGGALKFRLPTSVTSGAFTGTVTVSLHDERFAVEGGFDLDVKGLRQRLPFRSDGTTRLLAGHRFDFERSVGKGAGRLSGEIVGTFADGHVDVRGTLRYARAKPHVAGTLTVIITDFQTAEKHVHDYLGAFAPAAIEPADPKDRLAITGMGRVDFALSEWLTGNADVIVHPEGYITAKGEIVPTTIIPILPEYAKNLELLPKKSVSKALPGLDALVADVAVTASVEIDGSASIGPGTLHDLRIAGLVSTHPGIYNFFDLSGTMSVSGRAGISLIAEGHISARVWIGKYLKVASAGLKIKGDLELQMSAEAATTLERRFVPPGGWQYSVKGQLGAQAQLVLGLEVGFTASLIVWEKHVPVHNRTYHIGGASVTLNFTYVFGKAADGKLTATFQRGDFDEQKFIEAVLRGETVKEKAAHRQAVEGELDTDVNPDAPPAVQPPDPTTAAPGTPTGLEKTIHEPFTMSNAPHDLSLALAHPPVLTMATAPEPLTEKIRRAIAQVRRNKTLPEADRDARVAALARIQIWAGAVHDAAERAAHAPPYLTPSVPGFRELAALIRDYGNDFGVTDLGTALSAIVVDPKQPETVLERFSGLKADPKVTAQISRIIASGVEATTLRKIVDNVRPVQEDKVLDVLRLVDKMLASGSPGWNEVIKDLRIGGSKMKGALFVLRYIDQKLGWSNVLFEVTDDPEEGGRRWDAWVKGILYQFKSWYTWTGVLEKAFLRQILEDYHATRVGNEMALRWIFETSLSRDQILGKMKDAMAAVIADLKQGKKPTVPGYEGRTALFIFTRVDAILYDVVTHP
jgi:hypothetical protein